MSEPDYLRQHGDFSALSREERDAWFKDCLERAKAEGITWVRVNVDDETAPTMGLVEGWRERPADEGPVRWQLSPKTC